MITRHAYHHIASKAPRPRPRPLPSSSATTRSVTRRTIPSLTTFPLLLQLLILLTLATFHATEAHGKLLNPEGLNVQLRQGVPLTSQDDVTRIREATDPACGKFANGRGEALNLATADMTPRLMLTPGSPATLTWYQQNGDGAGPLSAFIDSSGTGAQWQSVPVSTNIPGDAGRSRETSRTSMQLTVQIPQGLTCSGRNGACLLKVSNPEGFVSCAPVGVITQEAPAPAPPAPAPPAPTPATFISIPENAMRRRRPRRRGFALSR
ncbi:hypothetical protein HK102_008268 [Quaeritorhiza haematococci]|nr:hypothetical protein HK102_008268 [Quaeritorhiza haematococci]